MPDEYVEGSSPLEGTWFEGQPPTDKSGRYDCEDENGYRFAVTVEDEDSDGMAALSDDDSETEEDVPQPFRPFIIFDDGEAVPHHRWLDIRYYYAIPECRGPEP